MELSQTNLSYINISLDFLVPETFNVMRKGAKFERFFDNLNRLVAIFKTKPTAPRLRYITVLGKSNLQEVASLVSTMSQKYLAMEHEFRCFWHRQGQDPTWVAQNDLAWSDLSGVQGELSSQPYPYKFVAFEEPEHFLDLSFNDRGAQAVYSLPPPLALSIFSDGTVALEGAATKPEFNLNSIDDPPRQFANVLLLQSLDQALRRRTAAAQTGECARQAAVR